MSRKQKCRHHKSLSFIRLRIPRSSIDITSLLKRSKTLLKTSRHSRSIRWLWTLLPTSAEPRSVPHLSSMYRTTSTFSPPLSQRTWEGTPHWATAYRKQPKTVDALLFVQARYKGIRVNPSTQAKVNHDPTKRHLISLWFPLKCHNANGQDTD